MEFPTIDKFAKEVAEKALDEITYEGKTVREWVEIIVKQQPCEDCLSRESIINKIHALQDELTSNDDSKWNRNKLAFKYMAYVNGIILNEPSVYPERPKGKWTLHSDYPDMLICEKCKAQFDMWHWEIKQMHFCPNCGSHNGGEEE